MQFANECETNGMGFYFKTGRTENGKFMSHFTSIRDDSIIIYCSKNSVADYTNIVNNVLHKTGIELDDPPFLAGRVSGTKIGIGAEPTRFSGDKSFNSVRSEVLENAFMAVERDCKARGIVPNSPQYFDLLRQRIAQYGRVYDIDPDNFCLEKLAN